MCTDSAETEIVDPPGTSTAFSPTPSIHLLAAHDAPVAVRRQTFTCLIKRAPIPLYYSQCPCRCSCPSPLAVFLSRSPIQSACLGSSRTDSGYCFTLTQIRASVPSFWSQGAPSPGIRGAPMHTEKSRSKRRLLFGTGSRQGCQTGRSEEALKSA